MISIVSQQFSITTQVSFNLSPKQQSSKLPKPDERPLLPGFYLTIVYNYKTIIVPNSSLNPAHPIAVAQAKPQPKDQMRIVLPFKLTAICRPIHACLTWGLTRGSSTHICLTWGITRYHTHPSYIASIMLLAYIPASCVAPIALLQFLVASINSD